MTKRVLVTGGAGFIGSHLIKHLLKLGHEVICVDDLSTGLLNNIKNSWIGQTLTVRLRRGPSDFGYDPMISPTLCQISFTALKSKFSPRPMAFAVGSGRMRTSSGSSRKVLSATGK
ncbi:MAG: NAD-dependent epimerase/dehydratase family protein [Roseovarius sp.]